LPLSNFDRIVVVRVTPIVRAQERPMIPSRRQFVASIAAVPFLSQGARAQPRPPAKSADPVLDQLVSDLQDLTIEFETQPRSRKATLRALESTLSVGAAHIANYDAPIQAALRRRQARGGRASLVEDLAVLTRDKQRDVAPAAIEAAMTRLEQRGVSGCFRDVQATVRRVRLQAPEQIQAAAHVAVQWDYCSDLNWQIEMLEGMVAIICGIAILEPTPGGEAVCGAVTLLIGMLYAARAWFC
jgi:hypothetical protein